MIKLVKTSVAALLTVPTHNGFVEALPAMAEHLTPAGQALAKWYWESNIIHEVRTIAGLVEQMGEVGIKPVDDDHDRYDYSCDGEYIEHLGQRYAVYW